MLVGVVAKMNLLFEKLMFFFLFEKTKVFSFLFLVVVHSYSNGDR